MRKLLLTFAVLLISVSAEAGQNRGLVLAAAHTPPPAAETARSADPAALTPTDAAAAPAQVEPQAQAQGQKPPAPAEAAPDAAPRQRLAKPASKSHARRLWESDEAKARRIAARYGITW